MKKPIIVITYLLGVLLLFFLAARHYWHSPNERYRFISVDPNRVIRTLGDSFSIDIPRDANGLIAAETIPNDSTINFLLRFNLPSAVSFGWLHSIDTQENDFMDYVNASDTRNVHPWPVPQWFLAPIGKGKTGRMFFANGKVHFFVDTSNANVHTYYLNGFFSENPKDANQ